MNDLIEKLSDLRSQFNCFNENEREAYHTLSEAIKVLSERPEPREDDKHCSNCIYSGRPIYKSPCSECHDNSQWEMKPISRSHENGTECENAVSKEQVLKLFSTHDEKYLYEVIQILLSATPKPRTGKWIINSDGYYPYCSECKAEPKSGEMTDFCPKCGAKMNGME